MISGTCNRSRLRAIHYGFRIEDAAAIGFDDREFFRQLALPVGDRRVTETEVAREAALALASEYATLPQAQTY